MDNKTNNSEYLKRKKARADWDEKLDKNVVISTDKAYLKRPFMPSSVYITKMDTNMKIITSVVVAIITAIFILTSGSLSIVVCFLLFFFVFQTINLTYNFKDEYLKIKVGFFSKSIGYEKIISIEPIISNKLALALSSDRILITYKNKKGNTVKSMISPKSKDDFCNQLNSYINNG